MRKSTIKVDERYFGHYSNYGGAFWKNKNKNKKERIFEKNQPWFNWKEYWIKEEEKLS